jgi:polygalacturonase
VTKPHPMMKIKMSGTYTNVKVLNSPAHVYSVSNPAPLVMSKLTIDNCELRSMFQVFRLILYI